MTGMIGGRASVQEGSSGYVARMKDTLRLTACGDLAFFKGKREKANNSAG